MSLRSWVRARQDYVPADVAGTAVGGHVVSGSLWSGIGVAGTIGLQFVRSMIFARLLHPSDFGVINLANVLTQFILIFANFGFNSSIIYWRHVTRRDLATCWWGNLFVDGVAALVCVGFAFTGGRHLKQPEVSWVICLLAVQFVLLSVGSINTALMRRLFQFKRSAVVQIAGAAGTFVAAYVAVDLLHWGVYGLVAGMIFGALIMTTLSFVWMPWLPSLTFSWRTLREHANYGRWFLGVNLVTYGNQNLDRVLIGTKLTSTQLGYYDYAANLPMQVVIQLGTVLNSVLFPAFASLQDDLQELRRVLLRVMRYNALIIYPLLAGLAVVAEDFVRVAYGEKWLPIVVPTQIFCLFGMIRVLTNPYYALCNGVGKPALPFKWSVLVLPLNAALLYWGVGRGGLVGVTTAKLFLPAFMLFTLGVEILRHVHLPHRVMWQAVYPAIVCCGAMAGTVFGTRELLSHLLPGALARLLVEISVGMGVYALVLRLFWPQDLAGIASFAKRLRPGA